MGKILKDLTTYTPEDKVLFFLRNFPKECEDNFDIIQDYMRKFNITERLEKIGEIDVSQDFYNYRSKLLDKLKNNFNLIDSKFSPLPVGNSLQKYINEKGNSDYLFYYYAGNDLSYIKGLDTSKSSSMKYMFSQMTENVNFDDVELDCSNCSNFDYLFDGSKKITSTPHFINDINTPRNRQYSFCNCYDLQRINVEYIYANAFKYSFYNCYDLLELPNICLDESVNGLQSTFKSCRKITKINNLIIQGNLTSLNDAFSGCNLLEELPLFETKNITSLINAFTNLPSIVEFPEYDFSSVKRNNQSLRYLDNMERFKAKNLGVSFILSSSTKMTREALLEVINNVKDLTGSSSATLTLGSTLLAKLTEDDIAIATNKNWTLA